MSDLIQGLGPEIIPYITPISLCVITILFVRWTVRDILLGIRQDILRLRAATSIIEFRIDEVADGRGRRGEPIQAAVLFPKHRTFQHLWNRFVLAWTESVQFGGGDEGSVDVSNYFSVDQTIGSDSLLRKLESIPGRLLTLGILGTFIGLYLGLPNTVDDLIHQNVRKMIGGLRTAFLTSIAGIFYSLVFLALEKRFVGAAVSQLHRFCDAVGTYYPVTVPELALARIARFAEHQYDSLRTLENDLAATLSESFGGAVEEHLAPLIDEVRSAVTQVTNTTAQAQIEGIQRLIDQFMAGMGHQLGGAFDQMGATLEDASANLVSLSHRLESAAQSQAIIMEQTSQTAEVLEKQLPHLLQFGNQLENASARFGEAIEKVADLSTAIESGSRQLIETQEATTTRFREILEGLHGSAELVRSTAEAQQGSQERMEATYSEALESFESGLKNGLIQSLTVFDSALGDILERFSGTIADMKEQYDSLNEHSRALRDSVEIAARQIGDNICNASTEATAAHERIKELSGSYVETLEAGLQVSNEVIGGLQRSASDIATSLKSLQRSAEVVAAKADADSLAVRRSRWDLFRGDR